MIVSALLQAEEDVMLCNAGTRPDSKDQMSICPDEAIPLLQHHGDPKTAGEWSCRSLFMSPSGQVSKGLSSSVCHWHIDLVCRLLCTTIASLNWGLGICCLSSPIFTDISTQIRSSRVTTPSGADMQAEPKGRLAAVSTREPWGWILSSGGYRGG